MMRSPGPIGGIITGSLSPIVVPEPPPTDPFIGSVLYLLHGYEYDGSANAFDATIGTEGAPSLIADNAVTRPTVDTVRHKFGQSIRLHQVHNDARAIREQNRGGPSDYLELSGDFTIEVSVYLDSKHTTGTDNHIVVGVPLFGAYFQGWYISVNRQGSFSIRLIAADGTLSANTISCAVTLPDTDLTDANGMLETGIWHNIAVERYGSTWSIYHGPNGGTMTRYNPTMTYGSGLSATSIVGGETSHLFALGAYSNGASFINTTGMIGSLEEFRFTSAARYEGAASYATPTEAFPNS